MIGGPAEAVGRDRRQRPRRRRHAHPHAREPLRRIGVDDGRDRALLRRRAQIVVPVDGLPARGHEQVAAHHRARVVAHVADLEVERGRTAAVDAGDLDAPEELG